MKFDTKLHDLRKYGFTFITGLLTVDTLFTKVPDNWKLAALSSTLVLIVGLYLMDRNYRVFQKAASARAELIERRSIADLTQSIGRVHQAYHVQLYFQIVYFGFVVATCILGFLSLEEPFSHHHWVLAPMALVAGGFIVWIEKTLGETEWVDFGIDGFAYERGESVLVVLTNIGHEQLVAEGEVLGVYRESDSDMKKPLRIPELKLKKEPINIDQWSEGREQRWADRRWYFSTRRLTPGLYRIVYKGPTYFREGRLHPTYVLDTHHERDSHPWRNAQRILVTPKM